MQDLLRKGGYTNFEHHREPGIVSIPPSDGRQADTRMELVDTWLFTKTDRTCGFILNQSSLSFHTTHYETSSEFIEAMLYGLGIIHKLTGLDHINMLEMRYIDTVILGCEAVQKYLPHISAKSEISTLGSYWVSDSYESIAKIKKDLYEGHLVVKVHDRAEEASIELAAGVNPWDLSFSKIVSCPIIDVGHHLSKQVPIRSDDIKKHLLSMHETSFAAISFSAGEYYYLQQQKGNISNLAVEQETLSYSTDDSSGRPAIDPISLMTTTEHLENVRDVLGLPISRLAQLLEISRQAVYKWMRGESRPDGHNTKTLEKLGRIAYKFRENKVRHPSAMLNMKAFDERSILNLVMAGECNDRHIDSLIKEANIMDMEYKKSGILESETPPNDDWKSTVSVAGNLEDI
ncbi:MAG: TIGR04255 family protein [Candidatus Porifericomitaceae bacterium WSBS_2022_MAG_OTU9]